MGFEAYRGVLRTPDVRRMLLLSLLVRVPLWAGNVVLTLHVVIHLDRSYGAAGFLVAVATVALSVSAPWRGRRLDQVGLRAALTPSLVVLAACWSVAPFVGYWPLLLLSAVAGLFAVPSFTLMRQALMHAVPEEQRKTVLAVDSVVIELTFMIGPTLGVLLATVAPTTWALFACEFAAVAGALLIWVADPPVGPVDRAGDGEHPRVRSWLDANVLVVLVMSATATVVLTGTDVGVVAALRDMGHQSWIGWELAVWGLGSAIGGVVYGALHRSVPLPLLLVLLAGTTLPVALAREPLGLAVLLFVTGVFCAPTVTASVEALSRAVPERVRGEALGWHGSAMTAGGALGAPLAGVAIDHGGWQGGFALPALLGLGAALAGAAVVRGRAPDGTAPAAAVEVAA